MHVPQLREAHRARGPAPVCLFFNIGKFQTHMLSRENYKMKPSVPIVAVVFVSVFFSFIKKHFR